MHIVDANVLLYAANSDSAHHAIARDWLDDALAQPGAVGFSWSVVLAFLRVSRHRAVFERPLTVDEAIEICRAWLVATLGRFNGLSWVRLGA